MEICPNQSSPTDSAEEPLYSERAGNNHIPGTLAPVVATLITVVGFTPVGDGRITARKLAHDVRTAVRVAVIRAVSILRVLVIVAAPARSFDDDVVASPAAVVVSIVVIIVCPGEDFRAIAVGKGFNRIAWPVGRDRGGYTIVWYDT